jgi:threonine synthase
VYARLPAAERKRPWILVATAHPAKFREIVEPVLGTTLPVPATLRALFERPSRAIDIAADVDALKQAISH